MRKYRDHDVLLRWRTQLTDFERDTLLPQLIGRLKTIQGMFGEMLTLLASAERDPAFMQSLQKVINPTNMEVPNKHTPPHIFYCTKLKNQIHQDFLKPISELLDSSKKLDDFRTFAKFLNELAIVAESINQNEATLFWLSLKPFAHVVNPKTEKLVATTEPVEYAIIMRPFDIWIKNLCQIACGLIGTVEAWNKEQSNWKTQYLAFRSNESNSRNNLIVLCVNVATVFLAVSVSASFLFLPDVWASKKEIDQLKAEKALSEKLLLESKAKIELLESALRQKTGEPKNR